MLSIAVRERGNAKCCCVKRFMFTVLSSLEKGFNMWIAVPKISVCLNKTLFMGANSFEENTQGLRDMPENKVGETCHILTLGQRCADWFLMRQFRVTGTNAGQLLLWRADVRELLGVTYSSTLEERGLEGLFERLYRGWFSAMDSWGTMMSGTASDSAVLSGWDKRPS